MLNIVELEKRWLRYKIKSYIPHATIFLSLSVIATTLYIFSQSDLPEEKKEIKTPKIVVSKVIQKEVKEVAVKPTTVVVVAPPQIEEKKVEIQEPTPVEIVAPKESKQVKLSPSLDFMKKMQDSMQPYYKNERTNGSDQLQQEQKMQEQRATMIAGEEEEIEQEEVKKEIKVSKIQIKRQNTQNDIFEIIERFKKNNNPALSLFVAKKYYELGDYKQSYNYALITNQINKNIESSWIIFAKSLVKLGEKEKAINTLKKYAKQSHSSSARILLDEIRSGKFR